MKWIKYLFNTQAESEDGIMQDNFFSKALPYSEDALRIAAEEAYHGEYTIEEDGIEESTEPTHESRITELEEAMDLLLSGVTE